LHYDRAVKGWMDYRSMLTMINKSWQDLPEKNTTSCDRQ